MNRLIIFQLVCALLRICSVFAFTRLSGFNGIIQRARSSLSLDMSILNRPRVNIYDTADVVGIELCNQFILSAKTEIKSKGAFYVAVPGGSALKLLKGLKDKKKEIDWSKVFLFYVNHKCVPNNDESATHFKAKNLFLDAVGNVNAFVLDENKPNPADVAASYEQLVKQVVPQKNGLPYFDLVLLGFGKDGHIGSLYPGRNEVTNTSALVLAVDKKSPASITLSLPVFNNAKEVLVVTVGADKSEAVTYAVRKTKDLTEFPVCGVRVEGTTFMIDKAATAYL